MARRARYHHGNLREALLAAGLELLDEGPPGELSLREVARRAGVSHAAPYRHFEDRFALLSALAEHGFELLERQLGAAESLAAAASAYVRFAVERRAQFRLMFEPRSLESAAVQRALARAVAPLGERGLLWPALHGLAVLASERLLACEPSSEASAAALATALG